MSLFVCMNCGCIENTNCCTRNLNTNPDYPNLGQMEMDGFIGNYNETGRKSIRRLCSECNTGSWHGEFDQSYPDEAQALMACEFEDNIFTSHPLNHRYEQEGNTETNKFLIKKYAKDKKSNFDAKKFLGGTIAMTGYQLPGANYRRRRDNLPQKEQLRRIAKAQLKREQKAERK